MMKTAAILGLTLAALTLFGAWGAVSQADDASMAHITFYVH